METACEEEGEDGAKKSSEKVREYREKHVGRAALYWAYIRETSQSDIRKNLLMRREKLGELKGSY